MKISSLFISIVSCPNCIKQFSTPEYKPSGSNKGIIFQLKCTVCPSCGVEIRETQLSKFLARAKNIILFCYLILINLTDFFVTMGVCQWGTHILVIACIYYAGSQRSYEVGKGVTF